MNYRKYAWWVLGFWLLPQWVLGQSGYWQQRVHYRIEAELDDERDVLLGRSYRLVYHNQSPATLRELYFHLYANAFQPDSYFHHLNQQNHVPVKFGRNEQAKLGTLVDSVRVNGDTVRTSVDNTILQLTLNQPLLPGDSVVVEMKFRTYFDDGGSMRRRMKMFRAYGAKHYNGVHWYPVVCVFDRYGWHADQHLDKEYYADFGTFEVALTLPQEYVVEGTGLLINELEVLPPALRQQLDLKNFAQKPLYQAPSVIVPREPGKVKTWRFRAEQVHNFAFTADPTYRIGEIRWQGKRIVVLAREPHASKWQDTPQFVGLLVKLYSENFGELAYPKLVVADAADGTEYGMMAIVTGQYPAHIPLVAHEVAHQWYYGMVANSELYRAFLDEGFAEYMTVWFLEKVFGQEQAQSVGIKGVDKHLDPYSYRYGRLYYGYLESVHAGFDTPLNTHSSDFRGAVGQFGGYGLVYQKGGVMLHQLRYVLGDDLFYAALRDYFNNWKFKHPYPEDFRQSVIQSTGVDLNWFFDQWLETTKKVDYAIRGVQAVGGGKYQVRLARVGTAQMPLDLTVQTQAGSTYQFHVPNTWFVRPTTATLLPRWVGWGPKLQPQYVAELVLDSPPVQVELDAGLTLADVNRSDNRWQKKPPRFEFDHRVKNLPYWRSWRNYWRPDLWYNRYDGLQAGLHFNGNYLEDLKSYSLTVWGNTRLGQGSFPAEVARQHRPLAFHASAQGKWVRSLPRLRLATEVGFNAGLYLHRAGASYDLRTRDQHQTNFSTLRLTHQLMWRPRGSDLNYLSYPRRWSTDVPNSTLDLALARQYEQGRGRGNWAVTLRAPFVGSELSYSYLSAEFIHRVVGKKLALRLRGYARHTVGSQQPESALYAFGANPEELYQNKFTRAAGFFPPSWADTEQFQAQQGGGLNVRAVVNYLDNVWATPLRTGVGTSAELDFAKLFGVKSKKTFKNWRLDTYLFADVAAALRAERRGPTGLLADAGLGTALTIGFGQWRNLAPLTLRLDAPVWVSSPSLDGQRLAPRWVLGVGRCF
jgi:aminopeptidase N